MCMIVNAVKQASAFPPNFIHSLDATHMMLTALECRVSFYVLHLWMCGVLTGSLEKGIDICFGARFVLDTCG